MRKLLLLIPLLAGCDATMQSNLSRNSPYAPVNEIDGGVVSYLNEGAESVKESRRFDAYKKMHNKCGGDYKIVEEGERLGGGIATPIGGSLFYAQEHHLDIRFECVKS